MKLRPSQGYAFAGGNGRELTCIVPNCIVLNGRLRTSHGGTARLSPRTPVMVFGHAAPGTCRCPLPSLSLSPGSKPSTPNQPSLARLTPIRYAITILVEPYLANTKPLVSRRCVVSGDITACHCHALPGPQLDLPVRLEVLDSPQERAGMFSLARYRAGREWDAGRLNWVCFPSFRAFPRVSWPRSVRPALVSASTSAPARPAGVLGSCGLEHSQGLHDMYCTMRPFFPHPRHREDFSGLGGWSIGDGSVCRWVMHSRAREGGPWVEGP